jgi:hypothetical protein
MQTPIAILAPVDNSELPPSLKESLALVDERLVDDETKLEEAEDDWVDVAVLRTKKRASACNVAVTLVTVPMAPVNVLIVPVEHPYGDVRRKSKVNLSSNEVTIEMHGDGDGSVKVYPLIHQKIISQSSFFSNPFPIILIGSLALTTDSMQSKYHPLP